MDLPRPPGDEVPDIVQHPCEHGVSKAGLVTAGTRPLLEITAPLHDLRFGQLVRMGDPFRGIWQILTGSRHSKALLGLVISALNLRHRLACVMVNLSVMMLQTRFIEGFSQPLPVRCPRRNCDQIVSINDLHCTNCESTGTIRRKVIRVHGVANNFFECKLCKTHSSTKCPHCGTNLHGVLSTT